MAKVKIKICGITNLEDALNAVKAGADALGFVFYPKSPRAVTASQARRIIRSLPRRIRKVGVFVNATRSAVLEVAKVCGLDTIQLHGDESPDYCAGFPGYRVIKAFRVSKDMDRDALGAFEKCAFLFDAYSPRQRGGTGRTFKWSLLKGIRNKRGIFLSGGLSSRNVTMAISIVRPAWVDASSSLETRPGRKDPGRIMAFIRAVRGSEGHRSPGGRS